jgi:hypothetical protein
LSSSLCVIADARPTGPPRGRGLALGAHGPRDRQWYRAPIAGATLPRRLAGFAGNLAVRIELLKFRQVVRTEWRVRLETQLEFVLD